MIKLKSNQPTQRCSGTEVSMCQLLLYTKLTWITAFKHPNQKAQCSLTQQKRKENTIYSHFSFLPDDVASIGNATSENESTSMKIHNAQYKLVCGYRQIFIITCMAKAAFDGLKSIPDNDRIWMKRANYLDRLLTVQANQLIIQFLDIH